LDDYRVLGILYFITDMGIPESAGGRLLVALLLAVALIIALVALGILGLAWRRLTPKERLELALIVLFL
jgi:hypothetical protein